MFANIRKISRLSESLSSGIMLETVILNEEGTITDTVADTTAAVEELSNEIDKEDAEATVDAMDAIAEDPTVENVDTISESLVSNFFGAIVKFFNKIVAFFRGIIQKIKDRIALMTNDRKKFVEAVEKQIKEKESQKMKPPADFSWNGVKWDVKGNSIEGTYKEAFDEIESTYNTARNTLTLMFITDGTTEEMINEKKVDHKDMKDKLIHKINILSTENDPVFVTKTLNDESIQKMKDWIKNSVKVDETVKNDYEKKINDVQKLKVEAEKKMGQSDISGMEKLRWKAIKDTVAGHTSILGWMYTSIRVANNTITAEYMKALRKYVSSYTR